MNKIRPISQSTGQDKACIVFAILLFILAISNFATSGAQANKSGAIVSTYVAPVHYAFATWLLLNAAIGLSAGITAIRGLYIALIALTIFGLFASLGGMIAAVVGGAVGLVDTGGYSVSRSRSTGFFGDSTNIRDPRLRHSVSNDIYGEYSSGTFNFFSSRKDVLSLSYGLIVIDVFSFIFLLTLSIIGCCVACCGTATNAQSGQQMTAVITTTQSYPGYPAGGVPPQGMYPPGGVPSQGYYPAVGVPQQGYYPASGVPPQGYCPSDLNQPPAYIAGPPPQTYTNQAADVKS